MHPKIAFPSVLAGSFVLASLLVGCAEVPQSEEPPTSDSVAIRSTGTTDTPTSPLSQYFGRGWNGDQSATVDLGVERVIESDIASCMAEQGFSYLPVDVAARAEQATTENVVGPTRDQVAKYGYYISTTPTGPTHIPGSVQPIFVDPNAAVTEAMSEAELSAYSNALFGTGAPIAPAMGGAPTSEVAISITDDDKAAFGCSGWARQQSKPADAIPEDVMASAYLQFQDLLDATAIIVTETESDPRVVSATESWSECLSSGGWGSFTDPPQPKGVIYQEWSELTGTPISIDSDGNVAFEALPEGEMDIPSAAGVSQLQNHEIALAVADFDCASDLRTATAAARFDAETRFVQAHQTELEQFQDFVATAGG